ncbi:hypothetical protein FRC03_012936 [Tulasnella sp. 419]|nr:hypothetical protein FRC03_012936 [Tulasnella sp. 419]
MATNTGLSTPMSTSSTLTNPDLFKLKEEHDPTVLTPTTLSSTPALTTASAVIESIASQSSAIVFIYDLALEAGFGQLTKKWSDLGVGSPYTVLQTRTGAGLMLAGRLGQGSSATTTSSSVSTAYVTPEGLAQMVPALASLPSPTASKRVVIQVPAVSPFGPNLALVPSSSYTSLLSHLPTDDFVILSSATANEAVEATKLCYALHDKHVIHVFDHYSATREVRLIGNPSPQVVPDSSSKSSVPGWAPFEFAGSGRAGVVYVALNSAVGLHAKGIVTNLVGCGIITVRIPKPWDVDGFLRVLPGTAKTVHVLAEVTAHHSNSPLYEDVVTTLVSSNHGARIQCTRLTHSQIHGFINDPSSFTQFIQSLSTPRGLINSSNVQAYKAKKLLFLGAPVASLATLPPAMAHGFSAGSSIRTRLSTQYDAFSKPSGVALSRLVLTSDELHDDTPLELLFPLNGKQASADFVGILDHTLVKTHDALKYSKEGSEVVLFSSWSPEEIFSNISNHNLETIRAKSISLYTLNTKQTAAALAGRDSEVLESVLAYLAVLRLFLGVSGTVNKLESLARALFGDDVEGWEMAKIVGALWDNLIQLKVPESASDEESGEQASKSFEFNAIQLESLRDSLNENPVSSLGKWHKGALHLLFCEAFGLSRHQPNTSEQDPSLRPDIEERTYQVTCAVNRRLTPITYDRNVFHLEFDTSGTGLRYEIGEALGVHGWNDEAEALDFCSWYGLDPDALVTIPVPNRPNQVHTRTVFQILQQQIDIFGKPPKSFYSSLADHAESKDHRLALRFIGAAEGSATFKKLCDVDTVTFADILKKFDSARPPFSVLCELIGDIKPRHYSIASAQSAVGDRVDLLVVTVDWVTPSGSPRFGQCTRYLAGLKIGQKVTVSIKPSVMKLPPDNMQPIIMAGLGTGAAPFRAFIQHRAHLASKSIPVGPLVYYFGSRHRSQEYLYGEELEAYIADGIITHAGLAFSRDGKQKVYIQHKMLQDGDLLANLLAGGDQVGAENVPKGVFYLCGPTWPVPDVYKALVGALVRCQGYTEESAGEYLESLKDEERYVLEVY